MLKAFEGNEVLVPACITASIVKKNKIFFHQGQQWGLAGQALRKNRNIMGNGIRYLCDSHFCWRDSLNPGETWAAGTADQEEKSGCLNWGACSCSSSPEK